MSILLDALRKSERQQRKGTLPDIHAEEPPLEASRQGGSRRWLLLFLLFIVMLVLSAYGWKIWQARQVPTAAPEYLDEPAASSSRVAESGRDGSVEESKVNETTGSQTARSAARADTMPAAAPARPANAGPRLNRQPRSPVETLSSEQPLQAAGRPATSSADPPRATADSSAQAAPPATKPGEPAERTAAQRRRDAQLAALQEAVETTGVPEEERLPNQRGVRGDAASDDGAISFWQLPEMTRDSLPEMRINVMVYDEDPSQRFIIMDRKRFVEGDEIAANLQLETVQRDRALFRYGAYLFYVKQ